MKKLFILFCSAAILFGCAEKKEEKKDGAATTETKDGDAKKDDAKTAPVMPDSTTMLKNMMDYATPGDMQKMMASWNGNWQGESTMWTNPGAEPMKATLTTVNKMIMNGLHQENTHTGNMMGQPFNGRGVTAYDNHKKVFVSTWLDNFSSGIMNMEGTWDAATKTMNMKGKSIDPATKIPVEMREAYKVIDDNNHLLEMFTTPEGGKEFKSMEIKFARKK